MDASCKIQRSIHDVRLTYKYVSRILGTYQSDAENDNGTYIQKDHSEQQLLEKSLQEDHFVNLEGDCEADEAEVLLIKNNYKMFEDLE